MRGTYTSYGYEMLSFDETNLSKLLCCESSLAPSLSQQPQAKVVVELRVCICVVVFIMIVVSLLF